MELPSLLILVSLLVSLPALVYMSKHPQAKGEPYGARPRKFLMISVFLTFCFVLAAGFIMFVRP